MNEPIITLTVIDETDARHARNREAYLRWIEKTDTDLKEHRDRFVPLKPRVTRENLYNL